MRLLSIVKCVLLLAVTAGHGPVVAGKELPATSAAAPAAAPAVTAEQIELLRKAAEESAALDDETKKKLAELYRSAAAEVQRATELSARAATFKTEAEAIEARVSQTKQQLQELKGKELPLPTEQSLADLEQAHSKLELQLTVQRNAQTAAEGEPKSRAERRKEIRARMIAFSESLAELKKQAESLPADEPAIVTTARKMELAARRQALEREVPALENELAKYDAEDAADLVRLQRDLCTQQVALSERHLQLLEDQIRKARAAAAEKAVRKARDEAITADPVFEPYAERNRELAELAKSIAQQSAAADAELKTTKETYEQLLRQFEQTRKKVESVGLTNSIGALLRKQRAGLPDVRKRRAVVGSRRTSIDEVQFELFEYDDQRQELANPELVVQKIVASAGPRSAERQQELEEAAQDVLERKREYLDALIRNYGRYFDTLVELDTTEQQIVTLVEQYQRYIDERVLWIRSGNVLLSDVRLGQASAWFLSGSGWTEVLQAYWADVRKNAVPHVLAVLLLMLMLLRSRRVRQDLRDIGEVVQKPTCCAFGPTLRGVALTLALAALWPGLTAFVAWRLNLAAGGSLLAKGVGQGLFCLCALWFPLELFRHICRQRGLAEAHFGWPASATQLLRRNLRWLIWLGLPLTFVTSTYAAGDLPHARDTVERICFVLLAVLLAVFVRRVLHPSGGVFQQYIAYHRGGWMDRLKYLWCWIGVSAPLLIAALAMWGYYYTAQVLSWRLYSTMCFVVSLVLVRAMLLRLILLRRRKLSIEQARERMAATQADETAAMLPAGIIAEQAVADLSSHSVQTQRLLTTGMVATMLVGFWLIWVEVLPALKMLDQWPLWTTTTAVQTLEKPAGPEGPLQAMASQTESAAVVRTEYQETSITFSNVALAILVVVITIMSARNVPGLLEISVLQRLPLDASVRYASTSLVSYAIVLVGGIVASSNLGLRWSQIQWLATALTFGLAFGLQEIFANFVAGLIILFERPLRVGDIVTVDDVTGVVSRIRIRATSITNWDRKEYVVPNKEFITGRLLNWTLSDNVNRIVIEVGVAYGSDTERARELLLKAANDHPLTLKEPPSMATFEGFGDNSLNLTLRTFLPNMENRLQVVHELHTAIDRSFREAAIEIAFPQRDLHIRSLPEALTLAAGRQQSKTAKQQEAA